MSLPNLEWRLDKHWSENQSISGKLLTKNQSKSIDTCVKKFKLLGVFHQPNSIWRFMTAGACLGLAWRAADDEELQAPPAAR